jgi:hypothetical protein
VKNDLGNNSKTLIINIYRVYWFNLKLDHTFFSQNFDSKVSWHLKLFAAVVNWFTLTTWLNVSTSSRRTNRNCFKFLTQHTSIGSLIYASVVSLYIVSSNFGPFCAGSLPPKGKWENVVFLMNKYIYLFSAHTFKWRQTTPYKENFQLTKRVYRKKVRSSQTF